MLIAIFITLIIVAAFAYAQRSGRNGQTILRHPYNNIYTDAPGARDEDTP
jgi:hypothetical protein